MRKGPKRFLIIGVSLIALFVALVLLRPDTFGFLAAVAVGSRQAGTWDDDPQNWYRAFKVAQPGDVKIVHSRYWRSNHFTEEFIYYFEVEATAEWRDAFLKNHGLTKVPSSVARGFRTNTDSESTPEWFAPEPVALYDVWDKAGYFGSVWINKTNGQIHFYDAQL
jgi:hypothetical protein